MRDQQAPFSCFFVVSFCKTSKRWLILSWGRHKIAPTKMADNKNFSKMAGTKMADKKNLCRSCSSPPSLHCGYDNLRMSCLVPSQKRHGKGRSSQGTARGAQNVSICVGKVCEKVWILRIFLLGPYGVSTNDFCCLILLL